MKKTFFLTVISFLSLFSFGQTSQQNGVIASILNLGGYNIAFVQETSSNNTYKSTFYQPSINLTSGQNVTLYVSNTDPNLGFLNPGTPDEIVLHMLGSESGSGESVNLYNLPTQIGDILFFTDEEHVISVLTMVDDIINETGDEETVLVAFEDNFPGFTSHRKDFGNKYNWPNGPFTYEELNYVMDKDFIKDETYKTILNENRMIGIGNEIRYIHSRGETVIFDKNDNETMGIFLSLDSDIHLIDALPGDLFLDKLDEDFKLLEETGYTSTTKDEQVFDQETKFVSVPFFQNIDCEVYEKTIMVNIKRLTRTEIPDQSTPDPNDVMWGPWINTFNFVPTNATITVNWGDATTTTLQSYQEGELFHTYSTAGTYSATTNVEFMWMGTLISLNDNTGNNFGPILVNDACSESNMAISESVYSGNWGMVATATLNNVGIGNGIWRLGILKAKTKSYKIQNGNWTGQCAKNHAGVNGVFRDDNCVYGDTQSGLDNNNWCRAEAVKQKNKFYRYFDHANGDIVTTHQMTKNNLILTHSITMNPCP